MAAAEVAVAVAVALVLAEAVHVLVAAVSVLEAEAAEEAGAAVIVGVHTIITTDQDVHGISQCLEEQLLFQQARNQSFHS